MTATTLLELGSPLALLIRPCSQGGAHQQMALE